MDLDEFEFGGKLMDRLAHEKVHEDRLRQEEREAEQAAYLEALQREPTAIIEQLIASSLSVPAVMDSVKHSRGNATAAFSGKYPLRPFVAPGEEEATAAFVELDAEYTKRTLKRRGPAAAAAEAVRDGVDVAIILQAPGYEPKRIHFNMVTSNFGLNPNQSRDLSTAGLCGPLSDGRPEFFKAMMREVGELAGIELIPLTAEQLSAEPVASTV